MFDLAAKLVDFSQAALILGFLVFVRVGAIVSLLPGFGEHFVPARVRLGITVAFAVIVWPLVDQAGLGGDWSLLRLGAAFLAEAAVGLVIGLALRLLVMALQFAGAIAAQTTALAQIAGAGLAPDPMPAIGNVLMISGLALAMALGLHVRIVETIAGSYQVIGPGGRISGADMAGWGLAHAARAFALAFSLAAPFVIAAFLYNVALGAINRAMPQLMVAFVGAPAITAATLFLLVLSAPPILSVWSDTFQRTLADPLASP